MTGIFKELLSVWALPMDDIQKELSRRILDGTLEFEIAYDGSISHKEKKDTIESISEL